MVSTPNPNWPTLFAEGNFGANPYYTPAASQIYTDLTRRLYKSWSVRRGKQFELDQVQPAEYGGQWVNTDGYLDPTNSSSPFSPGVVPFRGYRMRAQYPPSVNLLNGDVATGGDVTPLAAGSTLSSVTGAYGTPTVTASASAFQGAQVWQTSVAGGVSTGGNLFQFAYMPTRVTTGTPYAFSANVRSVTTGANPSVALAIVWYNLSGPILTVNGTPVALTGSPSATWTSTSVTSTVPAGAIAAQLWVYLQASAPGSAWNFQVDGIQWEQNSAATTFSAPGKSYPLYSGLIERYPQDWDFNGTYGLANPIGVDVMALLSQMTLKEAFIMDVVATGPSWFFPLNDLSGSTTILEQAGRTPPAGVFTSSYGAGTLTFGSSIAAATTPGGLFLGTGGPVMTVNNNGLASGAGTVVDLTQAGITGAPSSGGWTRMLAFRTTNTTGTPVLAASTAGFVPGSVPAISTNSNWYLQLQVTSGANMTAAVSLYDDSNNHSGVAGTATVNDNNWHLVMFSMSSSGKTLTLWIDGVSTVVTAASDMHAHRAVNDSIGADEYLYAGVVGSSSISGFTGDMALYAQWPFEMSAGTVATLYQSWKTAWSGERSDQRYGRILGWAGYLGAQSLDVGTTTTMGPATDVNGQDALTCLENVVATEAGRHFVAADGAVNFQSRQRMFQASTPVCVFGENQGSGEIPYLQLIFDYDPTRLSNQVQVTQQSTSLVYWANDTTSQSSYGVRNLQRTNQSLTNEEVREAAFFYLSRYKDPHLRVQTIVLDPASNPSIWPQALSLELGQYIQINRRDQTGTRPTITYLGFIEQIVHTADDQGKWLIELQVSPSMPTLYASFTSLRTTLHSAATSGTNTVTINALPDAATNPVRSQLTGGQQITLSGGGLSELLTIATGGVQDALAGYSTATVTFTTNLVNSYSLGASFAEATGANYDALAHFDQVQFAY